jgi:heterodisulfide reductase subunit A
MQAALDIANAGYPVTLIETLPSIGGRMAQLSETFPTLDCAQCILTPRTVEVGHRDDIRLLTYSEVEQITGAEGDFRVRVRRRATFVDWDLCTGCGSCQEKCPTRVDSEFDVGLGQRKAIYRLSPQAVPNKPVIDREHCVFFARGKCRACQRACPVEAISYDQRDVTIEERASAIVLATGYDLYRLEEMPELGGGTTADVIDALAFERMLSASGPTAGKVVRPSDGSEPQQVVFIQCAGSRSPEIHKSYCSKVCCMYSAKQAVLYSHRVHAGQAYVFYIDLRAAGKRYDEFTQRATDEDGIIYLRGQVSRLFRRGGKVMVWGSDTLTGQAVQIAADMVVLAPAMVPRDSTHALATDLGLAEDSDGWLVPRNGNLSPVSTDVPGIYLAGTVTGPMDIPEAVAHASGAAAHVIGQFARDSRRAAYVPAVRSAGQVPA